MSVSSSATPRADSSFSGTARACDATGGAELTARLYKDSRAEIAAALARGERSVPLVIAAVPGSARCVDAVVQKAGGTIHMRSDELDYLRASVPLPAVEGLLRSGLAEAVDVIREPLRPNPIMLPSAKEEQQPAPPGTPPQFISQTAESLTKLAGQFQAIQDLSRTDWRKQHPTFDGRGVTIAIVESPIDILHPDLQTAASLDGHATPKVIEHFTALDPDGSSGAVGPWVQLAPSQADDDTRRYRVGAFDLRTAEIAGLTDLEQLVGSTKGPRYAVLWDTTAHCVKVDTDQDDSFDDERCLRDFHSAQDIGTLPLKERGDQGPGSMGFTVQIATARDAIAINVAGPGFMDHATRVAGAALAHAGSGGGIDGVAPGARLVSIHSGMTLAGQIEGLIKAFADPRVDIVVLEQNVQLDHYYLLADGANVQGIITRRLIEKYRKPLLEPAGNAPGLNQTGTDRGGFSIGMYASPRNLQLAYRRDFPDAHYVMGSSGPAGNGGMRPQFVAPAWIVSTGPRFYANPGLIINNQRVSGYNLCGGTSCAAPIAAGAIACLISAAKQEHLNYSLDPLQWALANSAEYVSSVAAYRQGYGLLKIDEALKLLRRAASSNIDSSVDIEVAAPVSTAVSQWFNPPSMGKGLYEREGWTAGDSGVRTLELRRKQGRQGIERFKIVLTGNDDGTFVAPSFADLPLDREVPIQVEIRPATYGIHSARLDLLSSQSDRIVASSLMAVVAARQLTSDRASKWSGTAALRPAGQVTEYFYVPPGQESLSIDVGDARSVLTVYQPDRKMPGEWLGPRSNSRTLLWPEPGVWEVIVGDNWLRTDAATADRGLPVRAELQATHTRERSARELMRYQFTPSDARFSVQALQVPSGTERISLESRTTKEDARTDVDLYLFDCTSGQCLPRASATGPDAREHIAVAGPAPGLWKVVSDVSRIGARDAVEVAVSASIE